MPRLAGRPADGTSYYPTSMTSIYIIIAEDSTMGVQDRIDMLEDMLDEMLEKSFLDIPHTELEELCRQIHILRFKRARLRELMTKSS